ncbi:hypothetical protein [Proteus mirabilis]|uniref:hypothetical protein n=1 Tax=Proteus mirabilis TaxID=584 RepID=UPI00061D218A|nr:hypothetical protein [Proteus mirabilis]AWF41307.1 hypothetical protein CSC16_2120 [Proteus mirabilis]ELA9918023.1 hypothetical protein [Proteus mirabilis]KKC60172.1 hypothetical protein WG83_05385 [Proteus mirabilis]MBI6187411.1 hypothetical protein [Proteus mirabilis]MCT0257617.1 hypothetical protein [Proteus mirabilis]
MSFILSFIFGALSGAIATFLGLYKFYREKWWDKQFNIFSDVVDHFYTISICIERLQYEIEKKWYPQDEDLEPITPIKEVLLKLTESQQALVNIQGKVRFLSGRTFADLLESYIKNVTKLKSKYLHKDFDDNDVSEFYSKQLELLEDTSNKLISLAKSTLRRDSFLSGLNEKFWLSKYPKKFKAWCLTNESSETRH